MKGENRNYPRVAEAKPVDPEMRQEGLRLLARMIAQKYIRSRDPKDRLDARFGEIGRLFGMKPAGCSVKSATPAAAPDWGKFNSVYHHFQFLLSSQFL